MENTGTFLLLNGIGWSAISSIATVVAVIVALFLPFYQDRKKTKNLYKLIKHELGSNFKIIEAMSLMKDANIESVEIKAIELKCARLLNLDFKIWNESKFHISIHNSRDYIVFNDIYSMIIDLQKYSDERIRSQGKSQNQAFIEPGINQFIAEYKRYSTIRPFLIKSVS